MKGYPSRIIWANGHFQMVIIIDTIARQDKMQSPTCSSPSRSSITTSNESHTTTWPFVRKTPTLSIRSHLAPRHLDWCLPSIFEFSPLTPWPCTMSSFTRPSPWLKSFLFHSKFSSLPTSSSPFVIFSSLLSLLMESNPNSQWTLPHHP